MFDVVARSAIMSDNASKVGELLGCSKVFSVHFDWCGMLYIQHHFCLLLPNLQAYLLCKSAKTGRLLLHVLVGVRDQCKIVSEVQIFKR